ncbi:kinesin light chain 1 [Zalerion maritima]|uniref:Kinesin light chain 1 n=1 Tax=Zalerion maritima TaxID=339359 RepID=A0AAD5WTI3_9PEZI|nr:kinesin light chain 1 [Zalerion maritima]
MPPSIDTEEDSRKALLEELSSLPLAITQAAAYIGHNDVSISSYLDQLSEQKRQTTNSSYGQSEQRHAADRAVVMTTLISLQGVFRENSVAADCLFFMACVDRKDILLDLLPTATSSPTEQTVQLLSDYAVLIRRPASSAVELHRLVRLTIQTYLRERGWFH